MSREEAGYDSFMPGTEANGEVNIDDIQAKENVDSTVTYGLSRERSQECGGEWLHSRDGKQLGHRAGW